MVKPFSFEETGIEGLKLISPFIAHDERGYYMKYFEHNIFEKNGIFLTGHEEAQSLSKKGVIRGLHFQGEHSQDKLVRVSKGVCFDVAVDLRKESPTFGQWRGYVLSEENHRMLYIPKQFAHGFVALSDELLFNYISGDDYHPASDGGIRWDDPDLNIQWPLEEIGAPIVSAKDQQLQSFREFCQE